MTTPVRGSTPTLSARLSAVQRQLPLCCPTPTASLLGRVVNSLSRPLPTSGYGEISGPRILCLVSRQNRQMNRLLWQPTHIVLHRYETFYYLFEFKVFRHEERDTQFLSMLTFPSDPTTCGTPPQTIALTSGSSGKSTSFL